MGFHGVPDRCFRSLCGVMDDVVVLSLRYFLHFLTVLFCGARLNYRPLPDRCFAPFCGVMEIL
jgi:hypothetical protein